MIRYQMVMFSVAVGLITAGLGISGMVALAYHADIFTGSLWNDLVLWYREMS